MCVRLLLITKGHSSGEETMTTFSFISPHFQRQLPFLSVQCNFFFGGTAPTYVLTPPHHHHHQRREKLVNLGWKPGLKSLSGSGLSLCDRRALIETHLTFTCSSPQVLKSERTQPSAPRSAGGSRLNVVSSPDELIRRPPPERSETVPHRVMKERTLSHT